MAVRIRLTRVGATKQPTYRLVVADYYAEDEGVQVIIDQIDRVSRTIRQLLEDAFVAGRPSLL